MRADGANQHPSEVLGPAFVAALAIAFSPALYQPFFAVRAALLLLALGPATGLLVLQARRDRTARLALALVCAAAVAMVASPAPMTSLWGESNWGTGFLFLFACISLWAWGRSFTARAIARSRIALLVGVAVNVAVAVLQQTGQVPTILAVVDRPFGLTGNAVHLGALCAATIVLFSGDQRLRWPAATSIVVGAAGVQLSGGRSALALGVLAVVIVGIRSRSVRTAILTVSLAVAGVLAAGMIPGDAPSATSRAAAGEASGSFQPRIEAWRAAADAVAERPLTGHGPGRFRAATSPHRTLAAAQIDGDSRFADAHNLPIEFLVTSGLLGLLAFVLWVGMGALRARGPWAWFALLTALAQLVEPLSVAITPVTALAFGIAFPVATQPLRRRWPLVGGATVMTAAAAVVALMLLIGQMQLQRGSIDFDRQALASAERLLPATWPTAALVTTRVEGFYGAQELPARRAAISAGRRAVQADPTDDRSWVRFGALEAVWGSKEAARAAYDEALGRNPWSIEGLRGRAQVAADAGDTSLAAQTCRRLKKVTERGRCADRPLADW